MRAAILVALLASAAFAQDAQYSETITVARYFVNVRVVDSAGRAMTDLGPADFQVDIGGRRAHVEAATWMGRDARAEDEVDIPGRLFVVLVQTDFARNPERISGQLAFHHLADEILESLDPEDRVAVFSHDSHLKLRLDFTTDRAAARKAVRDAIRIERLPLPPASESGPSLVPHLDNDAMRKTYVTEESLLLIARALRKIEGEKTIILAGWGLGTRRGRRVETAARWTEAVAMLQEDHVPVISIGTGVGGALSAGLVKTAHATGGFFTDSRNFPHQSVTRIRGALAGTYELFLRTEEPLSPGSHDVKIRVTRKNAAIFGPKSVTISPENRIASVVDLPDTAFVAVTREEVAADLFLRALRALQNGDGDTAESLLNGAISTGIAPADAWWERGMLVAARGDLTAAAADLRLYLQQSPHGTQAREAGELLRTWQP